MQERFKQISIYTGKCMRTFVNERGWKNLASTLLIMLLISSVLPDDMFIDYGDTRNGFFALICAGVWVGIFNSIQTICRERDIIKREHRSGLHMSSYIAAHMIYEFLLCLAEALVVVLVTGIHCHAHMPAQGVFLPILLEMYITFLLLIYSSDVLGIMISSIVRTPNTAMTVMPFALIIELIMCGYIFPLEGFAEKLSYLTVSKWALNALCTTANVNAMGFTIFFSEDYTFTIGHLMNMWLILILFIFLYGAIAAAALNFVDRDSR